MRTVVQTALEVARAEVGTRERGTTNSGPRVQQYQEATTLDGTGWPWCAAFVAWVLRQTGKRLGQSIPWSYSASCDVIWADARARGLLRTQPEPGDVFLVIARTRRGYSTTDAIHTGFVSRVRHEYFDTVEGNTNTDGAREGTMVREGSRAVGARHRFVRWADAVPAGAGESAPAAWQVVVESAGGPRRLPVVMQNGQALVPAREWAAALALRLEWDSTAQTVCLNGEEVPAQPRLIGGRSYFPVRVLAELCGAPLILNGTRRLITVGVGT